jgi:hypothetical protein
VWRRVRIPPPQPRESYEATKRETGAWEYNWVTVSLEDIHTETRFSRLRVGRKAEDLVLQKDYSCEIQRRETPDDESGRIFYITNLVNYYITVT